MPEGAHAGAGPQGGYFVWLDLPAGDRCSCAARPAPRRGVTFVKGSDFFPPGQGGERSARLAYSFVSPADCRAGVDATCRTSARAALGAGGGIAARAGSRRAARSPRQQQHRPDQPHVRRREDEVTVDLLAVLDDERDRVDDHEHEDPIFT